MGAGGRFLDRGEKTGSVARDHVTGVCERGWSAFARRFKEQNDARPPRHGGDCFHWFVARSPRTQRDRCLGLRSSQQSGSQPTLSVGRLVNCVWRCDGGRITSCG